MIFRPNGVEDGFCAVRLFWDDFVMAFFFGMDFSGRIFSAVMFSAGFLFGSYGYDIDIGAVLTIAN